GDIIYLSDLKLPAGVEIPGLKLGKDHDDAVVIAKHGKEEAESTEGAEVAEVPAAKVAKKDESKK
ncbi:MAG: 50S ribosomal protein L25, partial [Lysobacteraceae bacterium]